MRSFSASILVPLALFAPLLLVPACSDDTGTPGGSTGTGDTATSSAGTGGASSSVSGTGGATSSSASSSASGTGGGGSKMIEEKLLDVKLTLAGKNLTIVVKDGTTPVMTDAWLYTLQGGTKLVPLEKFSDSVEKRRTSSSGRVPYGARALSPR